MNNHEEEYKRKMQEIDRLIQEPEISSEIDNFLEKLNKKFGCDFRLMYEYYPETIEYSGKLENQIESINRNVPTMILSEFVGHINKEDDDFKIYIDPLYLSEGLNEINDVLTTVIENDKLIIVPVSHNKKYKLK